MATATNHQRMNGGEMSWRDDRLAAREALHGVFSAAARFISALPYDSNSGDAAPEITVRIHDSQKPVGAQPAGNAKGAEFIEAIPKAIFLRSNLEDAGVTLRRGAAIVLSATEGYRLEDIHPHDHETVSADIIRLKSSELTGLPVPE